MSVIIVEKEHNLSLAELQQTIDKILVKLKNKFDFLSEWENETYLSFRRKGASGWIEIDTNTLRITLKLGIMFKMLKAAIQDEIVLIINEHL